MLVSVYVRMIKYSRRVYIEIKLKITAFEIDQIIQLFNTKVIMFNAKLTYILKIIKLPAFGNYQLELFKT